MATRIKLGELLVRAGVLDDTRLKAALAEQQRWGGRLGRLLVEMNFVSEDILVKALSKQLGIPRASLDTLRIPDFIVEKVDGAFARQHGLCPESFDAERKVLTVAMADPSNFQAVDELRFRTGARIQTTIGSERQITQAQDRIYSRMPFFMSTRHEGVELQNDALLQQVSGGLGGEGLIVSAAQAAGPGLRSDVPQRLEPQKPEPQKLEPQKPEPQRLEPQKLEPQRVEARSEPPRPAPNEAMELAGRLDGAQKQQQKAIRVMLELLIEKGVFSRDEYLSLVQKR